MVTTVTTTTVAAGAGATIALITILSLAALLFQKEIFSSLRGTRAGRFSRALTIAIIPLLIVFFTTIIFSVYDALYH